MEELKRTIEVVFTLARMKQTELQPQDEQALITLINAKAEIIKIINEHGTNPEGH